MKQKSWPTSQLLSVLLFYALAFFKEFGILHYTRTLALWQRWEEKLSCFCIVCEGRVFSKEGQSCTCPSNLLNKSYTNLGNEQTRIHNNSISSGNLEVVGTQIWVEGTPLKSQLSNGFLASSFLICIIYPFIWINNTTCERSSYLRDIE